MKPGTTIAGRYLLRARAGSGSMAEVYRARDLESGQTVAIKLLHLATGDLDERFAREVKMLRALQHPAIVRYLDSGVTLARRRFLVVEWLEGIDLATRLYRQPLSLAESLQLTERVASGLAFAHHLGVVHRDVSMRNIYLPDERVEAAKLLDFGVARWAGAMRTLTQPGGQIGTPAYMSPEQARGAVEITAKTDVFSIGAILYECLSGKPAFVGHNPMAVFCKILMQDRPSIRELAPSVPEAVADLLDRMLAHEAGDRPSSTEVAREARRLHASLSESKQQTRPRVRGRLGAITDSEQRVVHVIVAVAAPPVSHTARPGDTAGPALPAARDLFVPGERIARLLAPFGARCSALVDGSIIAVLDSARSSPTSVGVLDQAANAARCALALRGELPEALLVLSSGRGVLGRTRLVSDVIERAVALLNSSMASHQLDLSTQKRGAIRIDRDSATLLTRQFDIVGDHDSGFFVCGEHHGLLGEAAWPESIPFVGRDREFKRLRRFLDECVADKIAQPVLVTGAPGLGKSRLCREFLRWVRQRGDVEMWTARGDPMRSRSPLSVMADAVRTGAGLWHAESVELGRQALRQFVAQYDEAGQAGRIAAFIAEMLYLEPAAASPASAPQDDSAADGDARLLQAARVDVKLMGDQIHRACIDLLDALTRKRPLLLVIEDLHWADRATLKLLDVALRNLSDRPLMVLGFGRLEYCEFISELWREHGVVEIRLGRLSRRKAEQLIHTVLGDNATEVEVAALARRADGNIFFLEQLVSSAAAGRWSLPATVAAVIEARLDRLDAEARRVLRAASVFGDEFWRGAVQALVDDRCNVEEWLDNLLIGEFIAPMAMSRWAGEVQYTFRQPLIREVVYDTFTDDDRQLAHRLAGDWLEEIGESDSQAVAEHFDRGGAAHRAGPHYLRAAEEALKRGDLDAAVSLARRGIHAGTEGAMLGRLERILLEEQIWRGNTADLLRHGTAAMALVPGGSKEWYDVAGEVGTAWAKLQVFDRVEELAAEIETNPAAEDARESWLISRLKLTQQLFICGRRQRAGALLGRVAAQLGVAIEADDTAPDGVGAMVAAHLHLTHSIREETAPDSDPGRVLHHLEQCARRFEEVGDLRNACLHRCDIGHARMELGLYAEAEVDLSSALATAERMGLDLAASSARQKLALAVAHRGNLTGALAMEERACQWYVEQQDKREIGICHLNLAGILVQAGDLEGAKRQCGKAVATLAASASLRPLVLATMGHIELLRGAINRALVAAREAMRELQELGSVDRGEALIRLVHAEALAATGQRQRARAALTEARDRLLARAGKIARLDWRKSFVENVPPHAQTIGLAEEWGV